MGGRGQNPRYLRDQHWTKTFHAAFMGSSAQEVGRQSSGSKNSLLLKGPS